MISIQRESLFVNLPRALTHSRSRTLWIHMCLSLCVCMCVLCVEVIKDLTAYCFSFKRASNIWYLWLRLHARLNVLQEVCVDGGRVKKQAKRSSEKETARTKERAREDETAAIAIAIYQKKKKTEWIWVEFCFDCHHPKRIIKFHK